MPQFKNPKINIVIDPENLKEAKVEVNGTNFANMTDYVLVEITPRHANVVVGKPSDTAKEILENQDG